jgi:hypothetical protein
MATLTLTAIWVNLVSTGAAVTATSLPGRAEDYQIPGRTETFAGGRRRAISQIGQEGTFGFTLVLVPRTDVDTLIGWMGQQVQVRDNLGRKFRGVYRAVPAQEIRGQDGFYMVPIGLDVLTVAAGVTSTPYADSFPGMF